jgi:hypothetical protein
MSIGPNALRAEATIASQSFCFVMSAVMAAVLGNSFATLSSGSWRRPTSETAAPSPASARAMAAPMPVPPPVIRA